VLLPAQPASPDMAFFKTPSALVASK